MVEVTEKKHAVLGPSGWHRWGTCPGSVELEKLFPNRGSNYARWGTAAHELADICLSTGDDAEAHIGRTFEVEGHSIDVDMAMADCVNSYVSYVGTYLDREAGDIIMPEQQVPLTHITGEPDAEGTSDVVGFRKRTDGRYTIVIVDLKTGQGVPVFAKDKNGDPNGQLGMYALGALRKFGALYDIADAQLVIIQPPLNIVDDITVDIDWLRAFEEQVSIAAGRTRIGNAELVPGEKQCKFCRAKSTCPALGAAVMSTVTNSTPSDFRNLDDTLPKRISAEIVKPDDGPQLAAAMRSIALIEEWCKGVRAEVERRLFDNLPVPGYKLVQGKAGNRKWDDEAKALDLMKKAPKLKIDDVAPRSVVSVTVAEKLFKGDEKRWSKIVAGAGISQAPGKPSVAPESDPRPEYQVVSTAESFAALPAEESPSSKPADALSSKALSLLA